MKISKVILQYLYDNRVETIFGVPSGTIGSIIDEFNDFREIEYIVTKNEAAASYSACKSAKVSQKLGVCLMSGSVGVGNAINGIVEASESKAPMLVISGHVARWQQGLGAIQDPMADQYLSSFVKYTKYIENGKNVLKELKKAIEIAYEHPRGAVHIGIPVDVQSEEYIGELCAVAEIKKVNSDFRGLDEAISLINKSTSGLLIVGGGCRGLGNKVRKLAEKLNWRLVSTVSAKSVVEEDFRLHMGFYGYSGTTLADKYIMDENLECIMALGTRLGESATQNFNKKLIKNKLIHIDVDKNVFNKAYEADIAIIADLDEALDYMHTNINQKFILNDVTEPLNEAYVNNHSGLSLRLFAERITRILPKNTFYVNDIGSSMIFNLNFMRVPKEGDFECNVNYACMGSSVGAMGISRLEPNRLVAVFIGDGSFYMNGMAEILTAKKYNMKIVYFVVNNSNLRFVDDVHKCLFGRGYEDFSDEFVNISEIAKCMNIESIRINDNKEIELLKDFISNINGPVVVELVTDCSEFIPNNIFNNLK